MVDSEDVPLSVSREHLQDQKVIQRISNVVTKRLLKEFKVSKTMVVVGGLTG